MREYIKSEQQTERLKQMLRDTPQFRAFRKIVFPPVPLPVGEKSLNPKSLDYGLTIEEREYKQAFEQQNYQINLILEKLTASLQLAEFKPGEYIIEKGDAANFVFLVDCGQSACEREDMWKYLDLVSLVAETKSSGKQHNSGAGELSHYVDLYAEDGNEDSIVTLRPGTLFGDSDLLSVSDVQGPPMIRRGSAIARCPENQVLKVWQMHRDVFFMFLADTLAISRAATKRLLNAMPIFSPLHDDLRFMLSDLLETKVVHTHRSEVTGETVASEPFPLQGHQLSQHAVIVDEGIISVFRNELQIAELTRGDVFLLQPGTSTAGLTLVHSVGNMPVWKYCTVPLTDLWLMPKELWKLFASASRIYDASHQAAVKAKVDNQVSMLLLKSRTQRRNSVAASTALPPKKT
jgi:CRP-like cAMP-binding protein